MTVMKLIDLPCSRCSKTRNLFHVFLIYFTESSAEHALGLRVKVRKRQRFLAVACFTIPNRTLFAFFGPQHGQRHVLQPKRTTLPLCLSAIPMSDMRPQ